MEIKGLGEIVCFFGVSGDGTKPAKSHCGKTQCADCNFRRYPLDVVRKYRNVNVIMGMHIVLIFEESV